MNKESQEDVKYVEKIRDAVLSNNWDTVNNLLFKSNLNKSKIALYTLGITAFFLTANMPITLAVFGEFLYDVSDTETLEKERI